MKQNNITFTSFDGNTLRRTKKVGNTANYGLSIEDFVDNEQIPSLINSLEIDWNGMVLGDKTINTTGELLSA